MNEVEHPASVSWFARGDVDLRSAEVLLAAGEAFPVVAFHIQQAAEKYLKGYLLARGWEMRRIHDLELLVQEAISRYPDFAGFLSPCQRITEYYLESRYPIGLATEYAADELASDIATMRQLVALIRQKVASTGS